MQIAEEPGDVHQSKYKPVDEFIGLIKGYCVDTEEENYITDLRCMFINAEEKICSDDILGAFKIMQKAVTLDRTLTMPESRITIEAANIREVCSPFSSASYEVISVNGAIICIEFHSDEYGQKYLPKYKVIFLKNKCAAPTIFEELHHSLQLALLEPLTDARDSINKDRYEYCAYYWRALLFPEDENNKIALQQGVSGIGSLIRRFPRTNYTTADIRRAELSIDEHFPDVS